MQIKMFIVVYSEVKEHYSEKYEFLESQKKFIQ